MKTIEQDDSFSLKQMSKQLDLIYKSEPWYGLSITKVLESVNEDLVFDAPNKMAHSIAELLAHMITWREFAVRRLQGDSKYLPEQEESFNWQRFSENKKVAWDILLERLKITQINLIALLDKSDDLLLRETVAGKPYTFHYLLNGIIQHDLYHIGQIAYVQRLYRKNEFLSHDSSAYPFGIFSYESMSYQK